MHSLTALITVIAGCQSTAQPPVATDEKATPPRTSEVNPTAEDSSNRRDRAGIELGEQAQAEAPAKDNGSKRIPAAEFIVNSPTAAVQTVDGGIRSNASKSALAWVKATWVPAVIQDDPAVYTALLHEDFRGHSVEQPNTVNQKDWTKMRQPALGTKVTWGIEHVTANPNNTGRLSVKMTEAIDTDAGCVFSTRTLSLQPEPGDTPTQWWITSEERSKVTPCPEAILRDVIGAHTALGLAWRGQDLTAVQKALYGGFLVLDGGVESAQYNHAGLTAGAGRWVLEEVANTLATPQNSQLIGDTAVVTTSSGARLGYRIAAGTWRLTTLWRNTTQGR